MIRGRLLVHGVVTGLLVGVLAGVADALTTRHEFLGPSFLWISVLAWVSCCLLAGGGLGALAAAVVDPAARKGVRSPALLAALVTVASALFCAWFLVLVFLNVEYLESDTAPASLLVDGLVGLAAILGGIPLVRGLARAFRSGGWARTLLGTGPGPVVLAGVVLTVAAFAWRGGLGAVPPPAQPAPPESPNVVLLLIDTLRRDHLSGEGYDRETSPALDELASQGARFSGLRSQSSYTKPAIASLLTSLYPSGHRVGHLRTVLSTEQITLAEVFHGAGYRTAKFVSNPIIGPEFGFAQGTEVFHMLPTELIPKTKLGYALFRLNEAGRKLPPFPQLATFLRGVERSLTDRKGAEVLELSADEILQAFASWRSSIGSDPFFAYLHFMEPHAPYTPEEARFASDDEPLVAQHPPNTGLFLPFSRGERLPEQAVRGMVRAYDSEIASLDDILGRFLDGFSEADRRKTIFAVTSDHGEEFYEHGGWGHGHSLHEELLAVPLLLAGPGVARAAEIDRPAELVDVAPTLLELAGISPPPRMAGRSLVPLLSGPSEVGEEERELFAEIIYGNAYWARALVVGRWKLIVSRLGDRERVQLFDLAADPGETRDLAAGLPEQARSLLERLEARVASAASGSPADEEAAFDPVEEQRLRALGYIE